MNVFIVLTLLVPVYGVGIFRCHRIGAKCLDEKRYIPCYKRFQLIILPFDVLKCPEGYLCRENRRYPCVPDPSSNINANCSETTTILPSTSTPTTSTEMQETGTTGIANDSTTIQDTSTTAPPSAAKDEVTTSISITDISYEDAVGTTRIDDDVVDSSSPTPKTVETTTIISTETSSELDPTTREPVDPPECNGYGNLPGPTCHEYYECVMYWIFWQIPVLQTCPEGQNFSTSTSSCVPIADSDCID